MDRKVRLVPGKSETMAIMTRAEVIGWVQAHCADGDTGRNEVIEWINEVADLALAASWRDGYAVGELRNQLEIVLEMLNREPGKKS